MLYHITHNTIYSYSARVSLEPHVVRLRPRSDGWQTLRNFSLTVIPEPVGISQITDLEGNTIIKLWFSQELTNYLEIQVSSEVETQQPNPFTYLLEPWALKLPIDYPSSLLLQLQPYLGGNGMNYIDPQAVQLAQEISLKVEGNTVAFITELNQQIYRNCQQLIRDIGAPTPPGITWRQKQGACRDFVVLFMEVCRAVGLAARFVSGYQEGDIDADVEDYARRAIERHLHAWVEVYLPGAGWRGYDPTHGLAVADRHVALVASVLPSYTAPISGAVSRLGGVESTMKYHLKIKKEEGR
jgi:transglutaminase-like putative cysteine protease